MRRSRYLTWIKPLVAAITFAAHTGGPMLDPADGIVAAIRSAFVSYPKEGDPDWRSPNWIMPEECEHLTKVVIRELEAEGFQIVKKQPNTPS